MRVVSAEYDYTEQDNEPMLKWIKAYAAYTIEEGKAQ